MKTIVILILSLALAAAAFFTRPSRESFDELARQRLKASADGLIEKIMVGGKIEQYLASCQYKDRYLWVDVVQDGKTIYTGAFSHWFDRTTVPKVEKSSR